MLTFLLPAFFAADNGIHISLKAEKLFTLGPLTVTNAMVYGVIVAVVIAALLIWTARRVKLRPAKGAVQAMEVVIEFVLNLLEGPLGGRKNAVRFAPFLLAYFLFIIFNNLMGILPIVGPGVHLNVDGVETPLFRPFTADINGTIAMSVIAIVMVQILSIRMQGGKKHLQHYFTNKPWNPINFFIGVLEVFGEFTRILSLALRLFLNTAVGEILIAVFTSMILAGGRTPFAVIPILLFEVLVAGIQAYVFTILTTTYLGLATAHAHEDHHDEHHERTDESEVDSSVEKYGVEPFTPEEKKITPLSATNQGQIKG